MRKYLWIIIAALIAFLGAPHAKADTTVAVNLGQSSQNLIETGIGDNGFNFAQWFITQGACVFGGVDTTCTLSGNFTGSTPGFTGGTYAMITTFVGGGPSPLQGISQSAFSNFFGFSVIPAGSTITLDLNETGGASSVIPIWNGTTFVNGYSLAYAGAAPCSGTPVSVCDPFHVGETSGAIIQGPVTGQSSFLLSTVTTPPTSTPEPGTLGLMLAGIGALFTVMARRKGLQLAG